MPIRPSGACAITVRGYVGTWQECIGRPEFAAVWRSPHTRKRWLVFLCAAHRDEVPGARELTVEDQAELQHRRDAEQLALAGGYWEPPQPLGSRATKWISGKVSG